jgi:hypothetical protein
MASQSRRPQPESALLYEPQISAVFIVRLIFLFLGTRLKNIPTYIIPKISHQNDSGE